MKKIKKIIIVGGGTAGWITALNLLQKTFSEIVVVSSKDIPIIGVGESTTGKLAELTWAKNEWNRLSWQNVDSCNTRYIIIPHK